MTDFKPEELGDRLGDLDFLREMLLGEPLTEPPAEIDELETQLETTRQEILAQGDEVQHALNSKIDQVLQAIQVSQFTPPPSPAPEPVTPAVTPPITPPEPPIAQVPPPPSPVQSTPEPPPVAPSHTATDRQNFFGQIDAILQVPAPAPVTPPPPIQSTPIQSTPPVAPPKPTAIAKDEATQIQHLHRILLDEDVAQLRQINTELDVKLRQVETYLATSQQPLNVLLPLITELVQQLKANQAPAPVQLPPQKKTVPWRILLPILSLFLLIPLGGYGYWQWRNYGRERQMAIALAATPELSLYRLSADVQGQQLYLTGKVPNPELRDRASQIAASTLPTLTLNNNIIIAETALTPAQQMAAINQILAPLNLANGMNIQPQLTGDRLTLNGTVLSETDIPPVITALENIQGINQIINNIKIQPQPITRRLYFDQNSAAIKPDDVDQKLPAVKEFLQKYPDLNLRIIGYQHPTESINDVALKRAQATQILLEDLGIDRRRIIALGVNQLPPNVTADEAIWLSRTVLFEIVTTPEPDAAIAPAQSLNSTP